MSKKWFVVSEQELNYLTNTASDYETGDCSSLSLEAAKTSCRARPIPEWAEEFAGPISDHEYRDDELYGINRRIERIKR